ncbi:NAD-dependent succinate-semialdehyde dehydrogenase [Streptomyces sp. SCSIO 75703]|uniref:NAD-dependent succinate-semialdehyde dehydrogenase n=1 Tax=unclassified Streptomyces TaxID=2593676 RepID=UPI0004BE6228|nr:NAD-dependent succinate-semialdehyde dehydrogenase [Streptomyces sp. NRRL F-5065]
MTTPTAPVTAQVRGREVPVGLYVDGAWTPAAGTFPVLNPANGRTIAQVADGSVDQARAALDAAVSASDAWRHMPPRERADLFHRAHRLLLRRADEIVETMTLESGKPLGEARGEFQLSADFLLWYTEQIAHLHGTYAHGSRGSYRIVTTHQPVGPCLLITPWNFPLLMIARKAGAALAAGCTAVVKSAKETPLTCALFVQVLHDAGFPAGVVNLVHTTASSRVSAALMADSRLRKVSFTGSTGVGSTLLGQAAAHITNASMELGGDGPFLVLDDADLDLAAEQAIACKFRNAGQACVAANRIIVDRRVAGEFTARFVALTERLKVGDGFDPATEVGPIISDRQRDTVKELVDGFTRIGATLLTGGKEVPGDGFFFEPTVFSVTEADHDLCHQELFAPIAAIYTVDSVAEAVRAANDTGYGLAAYVFTRSVDRAIAVSEHLDFGMVGVNRGIMADPAAPFGGIKASGLGREGGHEAIHEFLESKYLAITVDEKEAGL